MARIDELMKLMPKRPTGIATYNAILEAAEMMFTQKGIKMTTLTSIIARAGVASQSFYDYFPAGKTDLVLMLHHYRRRRMKHALRNATNHIVIGYHMPTLDPNEAPVPLYLACRILVGAIFRTLREKPMLDREILGFMVSNGMESHTNQELLIKDEIVEAIRVISHGTIATDALETIAFIATFASKGVLEAAILMGSGLDDKFEDTLVQSIALLLAQQVAEDGCAGCHTIKRLNRDHDFFPLAQPDVFEPITNTIPKVAVEVPPALLPHLRNPGL